ncbi:MAG: LON peptidase substrate-binding domain-containing protein [Chloroflexi bacterium]|nr:LON peptidase substrate-binding domain-containing protein [Chloroflexota bacterium]
MPLPLHIFEPRYKTMINECAREQKPFGVALIRSGAEVGAAAEPHDIGTTARITSVQRITEGRLNVESIGQDRFRIIELIHDKPYLSAIPCWRKRRTRHLIITAYLTILSRWHILPPLWCKCRLWLNKIYCVCQAPLFCCKKNTLCIVARPLC